MTNLHQFLTCRITTVVFTSLLGKKKLYSTLFRSQHMLAFALKSGSKREKPTKYSPLYRMILLRTRMEFTKILLLFYFAVIWKRIASFADADDVTKVTADAITAPRNICKLVQAERCPSTPTKIGSYWHARWGVSGFIITKSLLLI